MIYIKIIRQTFACFTHLISYSMNFLLIYMLATKRENNLRVFLENMIFQELVMNVTQIILVEVPFWNEHLQSIETFKGEFFKIVMAMNLSAFEMRYLTAILMALNRLWAIMKITNRKIFAPRRLVVYFLFAWIYVLFRKIFFICTPFCYTFVDFQWLRFVRFCETDETNWWRYYSASNEARIQGSIYTVTCFIINVIVVLILYKRKNGLNFLKKSTIETATQFSNKSMRSTERILIFNSLFLSIILLINVIYIHAYNSFYDALIFSPTVLTFCGFVNIYLYDYMNFLIYFVFNPETRQRILSVFCKSRYAPNIWVTPMVSSTKAVV